MSFHVPKQMKSRQVKHKLDDLYAQDESDPGHELIKMIRLMKPKPTNARQKMINISGMDFYVYD